MNDLLEPDQLRCKLILRETVFSRAGLRSCLRFLIPNRRRPIFRGHFSDIPGPVINEAEHCLCTAQVLHDIIEGLAKSICNQIFAPALNSRADEMLITVNAGSQLRRL